MNYERPKEIKDWMVQGLWGVYLGYILLFERYPYVTKVILAINILLFIAQYKIFPTHYFLFCPPRILTQKKEIYRLITGAFGHANSLHLFMNSQSLLIQGEYLEIVLGKVNFILLTVCLLFWTPIFNLIFTILAELILPDSLDLNFMRCRLKSTHDSLGYSGVLFGYLLYMALMTWDEQLFRAFVYNMIISIILPFSFWGHLAGAIAGTLIHLAHKILITSIQLYAKIFLFALGIYILILLIQKYVDQWMKRKGIWQESKTLFWVMCYIGCAVDAMIEKESLERENMAYNTYQGQV